MKDINQVPVVTAENAVKLIQDEDVVAFCGAGGGITEATELICADISAYMHPLSHHHLRN